jgi:hypothetical protein
MNPILTFPVAYQDKNLLKETSSPSTLYVLLINSLIPILFRNLESLIFLGHMHAKCSRQCQIQV